MNGVKPTRGILAFTFFSFVITSSFAGNSDDQTNPFPRDRQQRAVGEICLDKKEYDLATRDAAFQLLCELSLSDGEYYVAIDELTKVLEQDPEFFFTEMSSRKNFFDRWNYAVESGCFVVPYLYTNKAEMEKRRLSLISELTKFKPAPASISISSMRQVVLKNLKEIKVRVVE